MSARHGSRPEPATPSSYKDSIDLLLSVPSVACRLDRLATDSIIRDKFVRIERVIRILES